MAEPSYIQTEQGSSTYLWNRLLLRAPDPTLFEPAANIVMQNTLGRGTAVVFHYDGLELVRRHYQRGGLVRHLSRDLYWGRTLATTRMWREFHLLRELWQLGLPVPQAVAARCRRTGPVWYSGDLITQRIPESRTLAEHLRDHPLSDSLWEKLGTVLAAFHRAGVYHADLNANNILLNTADSFYLIDFDKGERRSPDPAWQHNSSWQQSNLARLQRSLCKLQRLNTHFHYSPSVWRALETGYRMAYKNGA